MLLALAAAAFLAWITPPNDYEVENTFIAGNLFPFGATAVLLVLVLLVNPVLGWRRPKRRFQPTELALIWGIIAIGSGIPAAGLLRYFLPVATALRYYGTPENGWVARLEPHLKPWLSPQGDEASLSFYEGAVGGRIPWDVWRMPLATIFTIAAFIFVASACLTVLLRRQWTERERFSFPLCQLPLEIAAEPAPGQRLNGFFRNPLVWLGAAVPAVLHTVNGLHLYYPGVPRIDLHHNLGQHIPNVHPWPVLGWSLESHIYPSTIGFAYLLAQEIAFSMWFFKIFEAVQRLVLVGGNWVTNANDLYDIMADEAYGGLLVLIGSILYLARPHWREVRARLRGRGDPALDAGEAVGYRAAVLGLLICAVGLTATLLQCGIELVPTLVLIVGGLACYVGASWGAANAGLMMVQMPFMPTDILLHGLGSRTFRPSTWVNGAVIENILFFDIRECLMPSILHATKLAGETGLRQRSVFTVGGVALVLVTALATWSWLKLCYERGGSQLAAGTFVWHSQRVWRETSALLEPGFEPSALKIGGLGLGMVIFGGLMALRLRYVGWPLHPIGLIVMHSWTCRQFWFSFLLGWLAKGAIVRLGGLKLYVKLRPWFLGLILGDMIMATIWTVIGFIHGQGLFVTPD